MLTVVNEGIPQKKISRGDIKRVINSNLKARMLGDFRDELQTLLLVVQLLCEAVQSLHRQRVVNPVHRPGILYNLRQEPQTYSVSF